MWLVTHELNMLLPPVPSTSATASGEWIVPAMGPSYASIGKIEPIAPHFENGGIPEERRAETQVRSNVEDGTEHAQREDNVMTVPPDVYAAVAADISDGLSKYFTLGSVRFVSPTTETDRRLTGTAPPPRP